MKYRFSFIYLLFFSLIVLLSSAAVADIGSPAPGGFMLRNLATGETKMLRESFLGKLTVLSFWATYCQPCAREMPEMQALIARHPEAAILFINIDPSGKRDEVKRLVESWKITAPVLLDSYQVAARMYIPSLNVPATFIVDATGIIRFQSIGYDEHTIERLEQALSNQRQN